ncbi:spore gernimation protein [Kroppenstedtia pulmonis]|uniref:Spore gernimation protein n=1 Tax=Kroppenstedtia pulmonis TaxID=1380685 RepID=A0A7D4CV69_9BACL|nr:GerMN domain-containing protein [Kroppenstedtia pulmonis]QKG84057.1 spore gernimation protein [Kroppenstedtia pulmonis]
MVNRIVKGMMGVLIFPLLLSGCLFGPEEKESAPIDPPPKQPELKEKESPDLQKDQKDSTASQDNMELYFLTDTGHVAPYSLNIPKVEGIAKEALKYMVEDGPAQSMLPKGFSGILPRETKVKGLDIQSNTATIDFSKDFLNYRDEMEEKILSAITWTLTGFESVKKVNIWVNGRPLQEMPKKKSPAQGLTRDKGINLEVAQGVKASQSMPVTLYFLGQSEDNTIYYVPVTRMINRQKNVAEAALKELIKGPQQGSELSTALAETTEINGVKMDGKTAVADFGKQLLEYSDEGKASQDAINTIILSLTENTHAKNVKITVDGKSEEVVNPQGEKGDRPVTRPKRINPVSY